MLKVIFGFLKPLIVALVGNLTANEAANIAAIEAKIANGENTAAGAVTAFLNMEAQKEPVLLPFIPFVEPALVSELDSLVQKGTSDIPTLYAAGIAFLTKEEAVV